MWLRPGIARTVQTVPAIRVADDARAAAALGFALHVRVQRMVHAIERKMTRQQAARDPFAQDFLRRARAAVREQTQHAAEQIVRRGVLRVHTREPVTRRPTSCGRRLCGGRRRRRL
jgi:hypothetical protein